MKFAEFDDMTELSKKINDMTPQETLDLAVVITLMAGRILRTVPLDTLYKITRETPPCAEFPQGQRSRMLDMISGAERFVHRYEDLKTWTEQQAATSAPSVGDA